MDEKASRTELDLAAAGRTAPLPGWSRAIVDALRGKEPDYSSGSLHRAITLLALLMVRFSGGEDGSRAGYNRPAFDVRRGAGGTVRSRMFQKEEGSC